MGLFGEDLVEGDVVGFGEILIREAGGITEADGVDFGVLAQETVIEAAAVAEAVPLWVKTEAGHQGDSIVVVGDFGGILGLWNAERAGSEVGIRGEEVEMQGFRGRLVLGAGTGGLGRIWRRAARLGVGKRRCDDFRQSEAFLAGKMVKKGPNVDFALDGKIQQNC